MDKRVMDKFRELTQEARGYPRTGCLVRAGFLGDVMVECGIAREDIHVIRVDPTTDNGLMPANLEGVVLNGPVFCVLHEGVVYDHYFGKPLPLKDYPQTAFHEPENLTIAIKRFPV